MMRRLPPWSALHRALRTLISGLGILALAIGSGVLFAFPDPPPKDAPKSSVMVQSASPQAEKAIAGFQVPAGYKGSVFAAEPLLANPVAFSIDHQGRAYVVETFRLHAGVTDIRGHMDWLDDDLACRTVADRRAMMVKRTGAKFSEFEGKPDRLRRIVDTNGDGKADSATIFAEGFSRAEDGLAAGVLARGDSVWFTCIPSLWKFEDPKGTGVATKKTELSSGYGVHVGFIGHDLHGLIMGPDGRIYFSIGDRGLNVKNPNGDLFYPDMGAVMRCWPDGSGLEIFATGLRNPQELLFDDHGNLFTGDNNSDGGDQARWTHLVQGGDSGWRIGFQFLERPNARGPWNSEGIWKPRHPMQPTYIVPPIANIGAGPSGVFYDPGTGLDPAHRNCFFMVDFRGAPGGSGIHSFKLKPKGASYELTDRKNFVWNILATDAEVGPDGALYVLDWVKDWALSGQGRIYRFAHESLAHDAHAKSTKELLAKGMTGRGVEELVPLLDHADRRVRQEAQFELARRSAKDTLAKAVGSAQTLGKTHAIWGLGQIAHKDRSALELVRPHGKDAEPLVRSQVARVLGDAHDKESFTLLAEMTHDGDATVVREAGLALALLGLEQSFQPAVDMFKSNDNADAVIRHAAVMALASTKDENKIAKLRVDPTPAVRLGAVLALRRLGSEKLALFLDDVDPLVSTEAVRAIYDVPNWSERSEAAIKAVAAKIGQANANEPVQFRALAALNRQGSAAAAQSLAAYSARRTQPESLRKEALDYLKNWAKPSGRDPVVGLWRPLPDRNAADAVAALEPRWGALLSAEPGVQREAIATATALGIRSLEPKLRELAANTKIDRAARLAAIEGLVSLKEMDGTELARKLIGDSDVRVKAAGWSALARLSGDKNIKELANTALKASPFERQAALGSLKKTKSAEVDGMLKELIRQAQAGKLPALMDLELEQAVAGRADKDLIGAWEKLVQSRKNLALEGYETALEGGDADKGRQLFLYKGELACQRCHKVGDAGGIVGPPLNDIGLKKDRKYLLESIAFPNRHIAQGFETLVVSLNNGKTKSGILKEENAQELTLITSEGELIKIKKSDIDERQRGPSAMPADLIKHLTKSELRDIVEFLAGLKEAPK